MVLHRDDVASRSLPSDRVPVTSASTFAPASATTPASTSTSATASVFIDANRTASKSAPASGAFAQSPLSVRRPSPQSWRAPLPFLAEWFRDRVGARSDVRGSNGNDLRVRGGVDGGVDRRVAGDVDRRDARGGFRRTLVLGAVAALVAVAAGGAFVFAQARRVLPTVPVRPGAPTARVAPAAGLPLTAGTGPTNSAAASVGGPGGPVAASAVVTGAPLPTIAVHAAGAVVDPGVYLFASNARVDDVLATAGGALPDANLDAVNLAAPVHDGDRIYFPRRGEESAPVVSAGTNADPAAPAATTVVDLNTATPIELDALPGVGPATASAIIEFRTRNGRFRSVSQLLDVPGIGDAKLAAMRSRVRV